MRYLGEFSALGAALCWGAGSNFFTAAGRRMGSMVLNRLRITVAALFLGLALLIFRGSPWPTWATPTQVVLLSISGLAGFVFGDAYAFRALVILGPGRATLLSSLAPAITVLLGWPMLHEKPAPLALLGLVITLAGIVLVIQERGRREHVTVEGSPLVGVVSGVLGAVGQAVGYVISKMALSTGLDPLSATVIRVVAAMVGMWALATLRHSVPRTLRALRDRRATLFMVGGAFVGPFLGVTLSLAALEHIQAGVAASITAFYPVVAILIGSRFHDERLTPRTLLGSLVAVAGVVVLFLR